MHLRRVIIVELINFLLLNRPRSAGPRSPDLRILVQAIHAHLLAMMHKFAAEHVNVRRPMMKRIARRMNADERVPGLDPVQKTLRIGQRQIARSAGKHDAIVIFQRLWRQFLQHSLQVVLPLGFGGLVSGFILRPWRLFSNCRLVRRLLHKIHSELAALLPKLSQDFFRRGNRAVPEAGGGGDNQQFLRIRWSAAEGCSL